MGIPTRGNRRSAKHQGSVTVVGPMPPPIHGQAVVTANMVSEFRKHFTDVRVADSGDGNASGWLRPIVILGGFLKSIRSIWDAETVYVAVKADLGMWLTALTAAFARLRGAEVFLHHHSYAYVRERKARMVALTRLAGQGAHHIALSQGMARDLRRTVPEVNRTIVIGNAGLVDPALLDLRLKADDQPRVLGHLSNLSEDKGIAQVVDLAIALYRSGTEIRLIIGGPTSDESTREHVRRAERELGGSFQYRGPLTGEAKAGFFEEITHFIFPSRYVHEAVPMVLYEAMAAGVVCVATRQGAIAEHLMDSPSMLGDIDSFVDDVLPGMLKAPVSAAASLECRQAYLRALSESQNQIADLVAYIGRNDKA